MRSLWMLLLLPLTAGCWSPRYFEPRENTNGTGPDGDLAAVYQLKVDENASATQGEVRIWSEGARALFADDGEEIVELHVGFEVENNGAAPLELDTDALRCEELLIDGTLRDPLAPERVSGSGYASPGSTARLDVVFRPPTTYPRAIDGFSVRFAVRDDAGRGIAQVTPFRVARRVSRSVYYGSAFYGPYWGWGGLYGGWGWGGYYRGCRGYW